ncbi:hypothetical protein [Streptomyces radiopugnans]|uniref:Uncharacterized protein n=1 Tax=Streptomyces radiopugnans TaxID=403935 RepID=A0A1H9JZX8_9ACTN|nr:hypothetical protein [Streptomyces radiopugnans]SEQ92546.1 hypothetical protein SAMN05216481_12037 [Streptomyces radiopugnans]
MAVPETGARSARDHALAVLRVRGAALGAALLPAAAAVVLLAGGATGHLRGDGWDALRWTAAAVAVPVLAAAAGVAAVIAGARPAVSPTVQIDESAAPDLYRLIRDLADRLDVPAPSAIALTPDCDSWLEDRAHTTRGRRLPRPGTARGAGAPVLVVGSPFLWWMRVAELRALLAPIVAGTGPSAHPDIAAARRFVRGLDAAVAVAVAVRGPAPKRLAYDFAGWVSRLLLRAGASHAAEMERMVAAAAAVRAQTVDYGLRVVAQEQVGLAYAGWDRLLTRVALPAWRTGRWPARLDAGVVSALTELSRRDRLAEGFATRLGERPACDLLEEPGEVDRQVSLLAARLFHGGPAEPGPDWAPVDWQEYPEEVVDRIWRSEAARLFAALRAAEHPTLTELVDRLAGAAASGGPGAPSGGGADALAARIGADLAREEAARAGAAREAGAIPLPVPGGDGALLPPGGGFPLQPPRSGRELLAEHITAAVCCAAVDTAGAAPGLDWLDGPALFVDGERRADLARPVLALAEDGDPQPLRDWLAAVGVRPDKPIRLV